MVINQRLIDSRGIDTGILSLQSKYMSLLITNKMNKPIEDEDQISDADLADVVRAARKERGGKAAKYMTLEKYRASILRLMQQDVQLSHILRWLKEKHGEQLVLNTLRKYVVRNIGRAAYDEYLHRNCWMKTKKRSMDAGPVETETEEYEAGVLLRPPGISNAAWSDLQAEHRASQRNRT